MANSNSTPKHRGKCIVVSHQLPFVITTSEETEFKLTPRLGHAALYAGIKALAKQTTVLHVGWHGYIHDANGVEVDANAWSEEKRARLASALLHYNCVPVYLALQNAIGHYEHYCKSDLWPLFHYILWDKPTNGLREKQRYLFCTLFYASWIEYTQVNASFCAIVKEHHEAGDSVWAHGMFDL